MLAATPGEGSTVPEGSTVSLRVANGDNLVPDVLGQSANSARAALEQAGFEVQITEDERDDAEPGSAVSVEPEVGTSLRLGSTLTLTVATEPPPPPTPTPAPTPSPTPTRTAAATPSPSDTPEPQPESEPGTPADPEG